MCDIGITFDNYRRALVDMGREVDILTRDCVQRHFEQPGSNRIRFSITDLSAPTARTLPTIYMYRLGISLYDAQFEPETEKQISIPDEVIADIIASILRFRAVCEDFGVD